MAKTYSLYDSFTHEGFWWLSDKPEEQVAGTLTFSQAEGARLQLLGMFGGMLAFNRDMNERSTIHGIIKNGKPITLLDAFVKNRQVNVPGIMNEQYYAHLLCIGYHFSSDEDDLFRKSYFRFERLEEWLVTSPFEHEWEFDPPKLTLRVDKGRSEEMTAFSDHRIGKSSNMNTNSGSTEHCINILSFLFCEADAARSVRWHFVVATRMQELASLCTGHYLPLTHLKLVLDNEHKASERATEVEVFAQMQHPQAGSRPKHEIPLFALTELLRDEDRAVENWFKQYEKLSPAINLFFAVTGERQMFVNVRFLLAIQALEVFHRRTAATVLMPKPDFKKLRKQLADAIPSDAPTEMTEKLTGLYAFANEPSLMQRLSAILSELNTDFGEEVVGFSGSFARSVVDTRNYNTHFTSTLEMKALDGQGMYWATRRIILLLTYQFMKNIGIESLAFRAALERHNEFNALFACADPPV